MTPGVAEEQAEFNVDAVLIVDDDPEFVNWAKASLSDACPGAILLEARDGQQAIEVFEKKKPGVIILDMMMPKRSGFLVLEKIKKGKKATDLPIIIWVTGNSSIRHKVFAESLGVWRYMTKPFRAERLCENTQAALSIARS